MTPKGTSDVFFDESELGAMVLNNHNFDIFDETEAIDMNEQLDGFNLQSIRTTAKRTSSTPFSLDNDGDTQMTSYTSKNDQKK
jgi:hypothetical protein